MSTPPNSPSSDSAPTDSVRPSQPDFDALCHLLIPLGALLSPAELHGMLCGKLSGGACLEPSQWLALVSDFMDLAQEMPTDTQNTMLQLYQTSLAQLSDNNFSFTLLLPDDDSELAERADALGQWCHGFLSGFGSSGISGESNLPTEVADALRDLAAIAQIDVSSDDDSEDSEDSEVNLMEISEYVRLAVLTVFTECGPKAAPTPDQTPDTDPPKLH